MPLEPGICMSEAHVYADGWMLTFEQAKFADHESYLIGFARAI